VLAVVLSCARAAPDKVNATTAMLAKTAEIMRFISSVSLEEIMARFRPGLSAPLQKAAIDWINPDFYTRDIQFSDTEGICNRSATRISTRRV
jgi:hypothetical protein